MCRLKKENVKRQNKFRKGEGEKKEPLVWLFPDRITEMFRVALRFVFSSSLAVIFCWIVGRWLLI